MGWVDPLGLVCWKDKAIAQGHTVPADMRKPHGHHIVYKGAYAGTSREKDLNISKAILRKYNIDVVNDPANLMIANNGEGVHTDENAKKVRIGLENADQKIQQKIVCGKITTAQGDILMRSELQKIGHNVFGAYR